MPSLVEKLKKLLPQLENDGSRELAAQYLSLLQDAQDVDSLLQNKAFSKILDKMKLDFRARVDKLVQADPELAAMKRMFIRTLGMQGAEAKVEQAISEYIEKSELES